MIEPIDFSIEDEHQLYRELDAWEQRRSQQTRMVSQNLSDTVDNLVRAVPNVDPSVALSTAQAINGGQISFGEGVNMATSTLERQIEMAAQQQQAEEQDTRGVLGKIWDKTHDIVKSGAKWTFAGLEFVPQLAVNVGSRAYASMGSPGDRGYYEAPDSSFFDGLVASTDLGALMSGAESGEGYFIGEAALEQQQQAASDYRGTIDGEAWTFGRGFAASFAEPGSKSYNIWSGVVDAAAAIATPSVPGGRVLAAGLEQVGDVAGLRRTAGLSNFGSNYIDTAKARRWLDSDRARQVMGNMVNVKNMDEARAMFPKADSVFHADVVEAGTEAAARGLLESNLGFREGLNRVDDLSINRMDDARRRLTLRNMNSRLGAIVPGDEFVIDAAGPREINSTIRNADAYLRTVRADATVRNDLTLRLTRALESGNREEARNVFRELTNVVKKSMVDNQGPLARSGDESMIDDMFEQFQKDIDNYANYGEIDEFANPKGIDGVRVTEDGVEVDGLVDMDPGFSQLSTEAQKFTTYLPDARNIRRATSKYSWLWTKSAENSKLYGDARGYVTALDFIQNQVWRPVTLMTGGYMFRNMLESIMRQTTAKGIASGPTHPLQWIQSMMGYTFKGDLDGTGWIGSAGRMARTRNKEFFDATGAKVRELQDPIQLAFRGRKSGRFRVVKNVESETDYARGVAVELRLLAGDEAARRMVQARLAGADDLGVQAVVDFLKSADGEEYLRRLQSRWTNRALTDKNGRKFTGTVSFKTADGEFIDHNLQKFAESLLRRVDVKTGKNQQLLDVIGSDAARNRAFKGVNAGATADDAMENMEFAKEFLDEINELNVATRNTDNALPEFVKIDQPLDKQMIGGRSKFDWWNNTMNHFFSSVFGRKEAFLNRSPVFRQYYYKKVNDLVQAGEVTPEALRAAYNSIAEGAFEQAQEQLRLLRSLSPTQGGKYEWDGKLISAKQRDRLIAKADKDMGKVGGRIRVTKGPDGKKVYRIVDDEWAARYVGSPELWDTIKRAQNGQYIQPTNPRYVRLSKLQPGADGKYIVDGKSLTPKQYERVLEEARGLSRDQLSFIGKAFAMEETKRVFYNASEVNNFTDIMRIVVPFGPAWGEALRFYRKEVLTKPNRLKNMSVTAQGFRDMDPDGDGKGFMYKDPVTGEMVFNYPFSTDMIPLIGAVGGGIGFETLFGRGRSGPMTFAAGAIAGGGLGYAGKGVVEERLGDVGMSFVAPAQSLSQSFQVLPGFGPAVQMSAQRLLGDKPRFDEVLQIIAPFGAYENPLESIVPSWAEKISQAITADPDSDRLFASLYVDAFRSMYATGQYDNTSPDQMEELRQRSRDVARTLLVLRGIGQFVGPVRPEPELIVPTKFEGEVTVNDVTEMVEGNIPASLLASAFRTMQDEDYENAVVNFLAAFGDDTMMFLPGLSQSNVQGLQATDLFGDWERRNGDVREKFPDVYGYFAPIGGEFELQTYLRQIREKDRERISDTQEIQADAEAVVGKALYMHAVRQAGTDPSDVAKETLREYRDQLEAELPGFKTQPLNINERQQILDQILTAADNVSLADNEIAQSIAKYSVYRDQMLEVALARDGNTMVGQRAAGQSEADYKNWLRTAGFGILGRKDNADLRQWLRAVGDRLTNETPEFERVWSRVLFDEVDI